MHIRTPIIAALAAVAAFSGAQSSYTHTYTRTRSSYPVQRYSNYSPISVTVDGTPVAFNDAAPRMVNGRVLVPLRGVFEQMGAYVHWTDATQTVDATKGNTSVSLRIGDPVATVNGSPVRMDVPATLVGGSTMVPLRFVSEALGANVDWNDQANAVMITTGNAAAVNTSVTRNTYTQTTTTTPNYTGTTQQSYNNTPAGVFVNPNGTVNYNGTTYPVGTTINPDGTIRFNGNLYPAGTIINNDGTVRFNGNLYPAGTIINADGSLRYNGNTYPAGTIINPDGSVRYTTPTNTYSSYPNGAMVNSNGTISYNGALYPAGTVFNPDGSFTINGVSYPAGSTMNANGSIVYPNGTVVWPNGYNNNTTTMTTNTYSTMHAAIPANTIIPVTLNTNLSSDTSRSGDQFAATVNTTNNSNYAGIPAGTVIMGHVVNAIPRNGNNPGTLQLGFDQIQLPGGRVVPIDGQLASLDTKNITRSDNGVIQAKGDNTKPLVYVGYGAGAGAVIGVLTHGNVLTDALIGGGLGFLVNLLQQDRTNPHNVSLNSGTQLGVRLNRDVTL
jgi:hypothetical protein